MRIMLIKYSISILFICFAAPLYSQSVKVQKEYNCFDSSGCCLVEKKLYNNIGKVISIERYSCSDSSSPIGIDKLYYDDTNIVYSVIGRNCTKYEYNKIGCLVKELVFRDDTLSELYKLRQYVYESGKLKLKSNYSFTYDEHKKRICNDSLFQRYTYNSKSQLVADTLFTYEYDSVAYFSADIYSYFDGGYQVKHVFTYPTDRGEFSEYDGRKFESTIDSVFTDTADRIVLKKQYEGGNVYIFGEGINARRVVGYDAIHRYTYNKLGLLVKDEVEFFSINRVWKKRSVVYKHTIQ